MEKACSINMIQDLTNIPNLDAWLRATAGQKQVANCPNLLIVFVKTVRASIYDST